MADVALSAKTTFSRASGCPKCGTTDPQIRYDKDGDFLVRTCKCCGHEWAETPLDKGEK